MQIGENTSGPARRALDLEDYLDIARRHSAWIMGPAFAGLVIAVVAAFVWPDTYISSATIRVVPPQVPENLVPPNVVNPMSDRINAMYQTISSRSALTNIVNVYNLYPRDRQRKPMEDVVEGMRRSIRIGGVTPIGDTGPTNAKSQLAAFQISFAYENRILAQKVTADLVSRFMTENTRERTTQSVLTTQFLKDQLETAKKDLDQIEEKLSAYRQSFQGRLPEQMAQNQMQLNNLEQRTSNINNSMARVSQEKLLYESDLRSMKTQRAALAPSPESVVQRQRNQLLDQADRDIIMGEARLNSLREHYTDKNPDVVQMIGQVNQLKRVREKLMAREQALESADQSSDTPKRADPAFEREQRVLDANISRLEAQLKAKEIETEEYRKELGNVEKSIKVSQERITSAPASEQQYGELIRDLSLSKVKYEELNRKRSQSQIAEDLEKRQQGETLELLDPASLPQTPTEPKRPVIIGIGFAVGLVIGVALVGAREARDSTLKNLKDVRAYTQLNVLGSIPLLENDLVVRRRRRLAWLAWSTACLVGILIMTGSVFYYYATKV
ncbi:MAG: GNVR domain-containing protein [Bryobacteraceae bacterium]|nr:GNVR domain-containing protein [Bryobacteraceae bacterium]